MNITKNFLENNLYSVNSPNIFISKKLFFLTLIIILISLIFRVYRYENLQYWSADEALGAQVVVKMIKKHLISLIESNTSANFSLGSFYYILSIPLFYFSNLNPITIELIMSFIGVLTSVLLFWGARSIGGIKFGFIAALLYSGSFLISLYDRRWWQLSLNPLLGTIAFVSIYEIVARKRHLFAVPLAIAASFAFHADPTIATVGLTAIISLVIFKTKILRKEYLYALVIVFFSA